MFGGNSAKPIAISLNNLKIFSHFHLNIGESPFLVAKERLLSLKNYVQIVKHVQTINSNNTNNFIAEKL